MELFKVLKEKKYSELKDYCADRISTIIANKITSSKNSYLNKLRGIDENTKVIIKTDSDDDSDDHEEAVDTDDSEGDGEKSKKKFPFAKKKSQNDLAVKESKEDLEDDSEEEMEDDSDETKEVVKKTSKKKDIKSVTPKLDKPALLGSKYSS